MTDFIWPSDAARAENSELDRVCEYLEEALDEHDALAAHVAELVEALMEALELMVTTHDEGGWPTAAITIARAALAAHRKPKETNDDRP